MKRALLSVTDKTGIVELAKGLDELGYAVAQGVACFNATTAVYFLS